MRDNQKDLIVLALNIILSLALGLALLLFSSEIAEKIIEIFLQISIVTLATGFIAYQINYVKKDLINNLKILSIFSLVTIIFSILTKVFTNYLMIYTFTYTITTISFSVIILTLGYILFKRI